MKPWDKIKEIPAFISAIIAVIATIIAILTWVTGYFATQKQLKESRCLAEININILYEQVKHKIVLDEYLKCINEVDALEEKKKNNQSISSTDQQKLNELKTQAKSKWKIIDNAIGKMEWLYDVLKSGNLMTPDGVCKSKKGA
jgi:hypothetical protein